MSTQKEYKTISEISGPLVVVSGIGEVMYGEVVEVRIPGEKIPRLGKVLDAQKNKAVVQMFHPTSGTQITDARVRFRGEVEKICLSKNMLGRIFSGDGKERDGGPEIVPEKRENIEGAALNPWSREYPDDLIQTGVSSIDIMNTLVRGQKLPIFSGSGMPHGKLAAQIARQSQVSSGEEFAIVFATMGVTFDEAEFFRREFESTGALERSVLFLNTAADPVVERIATPRYALTTAEFLAFEHDMHVLVIMTDMTNYCEALREVSSVRKEIPGRRGYPGYTYTDLASLYERAGKIKGKPGTITQLPILSMPDDDKTHPVPDLTGYITEGQFILSRELNTKGVTPPVDVQGSLSRLQPAVLGGDKTREDHAEVKNQLSASYAQGKEARELAVVLGESSLSEADRAHMNFANEFEQKFISQGEYENRTIDDSLEIAWDLLRKLPAESLKRIKSHTAEKYLGSKDQ
ncbi:MAG: V-type ATP synthase subunit B [Candidatus Paceibacterota bacterium]